MPQTYLRFPLPKRVPAWVQVSVGADSGADPTHARIDTGTRKCTCHDGRHAHSHSCAEAPSLARHGTHTQASIGCRCSVTAVDLGAMPRRPHSHLPCPLRGHATNPVVLEATAATTSLGMREATATGTPPQDESLGAGGASDRAAASIASEEHDRWNSPAAVRQAARAGQELSAHGYQATA